MKSAILSNVSLLWYDNVWGANARLEFIELKLVSEKAFYKVSDMLELQAFLFTHQ